MLLPSLCCCQSEKLINNFNIKSSEKGKSKYLGNIGCFYTKNVSFNFRIFLFFSPKWWILVAEINKWLLMFKSPLSIKAGSKCSVLCCDKKQCQDLRVQSLKILKNQIQAGLFLHQVSVPKKAAQIKIMQIKTKFPFTQWSLGEWQPHPV